ncbi:hypothetical protein R1flu_026173 [Riccia fluitans]|uniref:Uncharacterized protein n=1 Tax=Riccia fluitans TaxID=41844 RepID=A0ABD1XFN8_9MARC
MLEPEECIWELEVGGFAGAFSGCFSYSVRWLTFQAGRQHLQAAVNTRLRTGNPIDIDCGHRLPSEYAHCITRFHSFTWIFASIPPSGRKESTIQLPFSSSSQPAISSPAFFIITAAVYPVRSLS